MPHMLNNLKFVSIFPTIQGEGINCGKATTFIRLHTEDCFPNKKVCSFCDTINKKNYNKNLNINNIEEYLKKHKPNMITLTGGEPFSLDFESLRSLILICKKYCNYLEVETNGAYLSLFKNNENKMFLNNIDNFNISPKLKTSNVNWEYKHLYKFLRFKKNGIFKFVVSRKNLLEELEEISEWDRPLNLKDKIWLMPMTPCDLDFEKELFDICIQKGYNYSTRLHITLFGNIEKEI